MAVCETRTKTSNSVMTGLMFANTVRNQFGVLANAMMKVSKYSASGTTHNSGIEAMSVVMWNVTPSIRLDGTNESASHFSLRPSVGSGSLTGGVCVSGLPAIFS